VGFAREGDYIILIQFRCIAKLKQGFHFLHHPVHQYANTERLKLVHGSLWKTIAVERLIYSLHNRHSHNSNICN